MLRAHMPNAFEAPAAKVSVNTGDTLNVLVVDQRRPETSLAGSRQEALHAIADGRVQQLHNVSSEVNDSLDRKKLAASVAPFQGKSLGGSPSGNHPSNSLQRTSPDCMSGECTLAFPRN